MEISAKRLENMARGLLYNLALIVSDIYKSDNNLEDLSIKMVNTFKMNSTEELIFRDFICDLINEREGNL
jgi:hypothetical protein